MYNKNAASNTNEINAELEFLSNLCKGIGFVLAISGVGGAIGAVNGALGYSVIVATNGPIAPGYNLQNAVVANAIGGGILAIAFISLKACIFYNAPSCVNNCLDVNSENQNSNKLAKLFCISAVILPVNVISGILESLTGSAVLNLLPYTVIFPTLQSDFAAAIGAAGGALSVLAIFVPLILLRTLYVLFMAAGTQCNLNPVCSEDQKYTPPILHAFSSCTKQKTSIHAKDVPVSAVSRLTLV